MDNLEEIKNSANLCLNCKNPTCVEGCPVHNNIPMFIKLCKEEKYDEALKTFNLVTEPTFKAVVEEARGDVYVAKKDIENAKKSYQSAWNELLEQKQDRQILQIKLESVGVLVEDADIERPILDTQVDET